jgi:hypothetical protein
VGQNVTQGLGIKECYRLKVFENRVLRIMFVPKREEVAGSWRKLGAVTTSKDVDSIYLTQGKDQWGLLRTR